MKVQPEMSFDSENEPFDVKRIWNTILLMRLTISIQNYKIVFQLSL
jgi:hypothetical protein